MKHKHSLQNSQRVQRRSTRVSTNSQSSRKRLRSSDREAGMIAETSLKLFFGLFVSLVTTISLCKLLPYHFSQSAKLTELRAQVKETESRVNIKRQQLQQNFDSEKMETLMEKHSSRIGKDRVRVFLQQSDSSSQ